MLGWWHDSGGGILVELTLVNRTSKLSNCYEHVDSLTSGRVSLNVCLSPLWLNKLMTLSEKGAHSDCEHGQTSAGPLPPLQARCSLSDALCFYYQLSICEQSIEQGTESCAQRQGSQQRPERQRGDV